MNLVKNSSKLAPIVFGMAAAWLTASNVAAATIRVPAEQPTIQAGLDAATGGDTVLVSNGVYTGDGNRDLDFGGNNIVLISENGPDVTIIACDGSGTEPHRGFYFHRGEDTSSVVSGFTINGGYVYGGGAGIRCDSGSSPRLENLVLTDNLAHNSNGAGIACDGSNPIVRGCHIIDNFARNGDCCASGGGLALRQSNPVIENTTVVQNTAGWGGGIYCWLSWPEVTNCTIADNQATGGWMTGPGSGGGLHLEADSRPTIVKTIIATNLAEIDGAIFRDQNSWAIMTCCDMYLNEGGDWTGDWEYMGTTDGNFSEKPRFCDTAIGDYHISNASYCVPERSGCGELVGALGVGCEVYDGPVWHVAVTGDDSTGNGSSELPFATIQQAVDWAFPGDTIIVHDGTYVGDGNRDINFGGKNLMLRSENGPEVTVIDCEGSSEEPHRAFSFTNGEDSSGVVQGFTITGGWHAEGSAVLCDTSSPTLSGNIFIGDTTDGWSWVSQYLIFCRQSKSLIDGNIFKNIPSHVLKCDGSNVRILGNLFIGNLGRAVYCYYSSPLIVGNTIADNDLEGSGGAVYCYQSNPVIKNTIMWGNGNPQIYSGWGSYPLLVTYCAVEGGYEGEGNISIPPLFLSPSDGDYNVCSQSACIDGGDPDMFDPDGTRADIGFYFDDHPDCPIGLRTLLHVDTSGNDLTADGSEENPFRTIQQAVNFALDGDTILVARGVYAEDVMFYGREILLTSHLLYSDDRTDIEETIIDGDSSGAAVSFEHGESRNSRLNGFTVCNSYGGEAGIACLNGSSPTISSNVIRDNYGTSGGISCRDSSDALILNNEIVDNTGVGSYGWFGIYFPGAGGIYCSTSSPEIINNTIAYNHTTYNDNAVGLYCLGGSTPVVFNTILWGNPGSEIYVKDSSAPTVRYSDIDGGWDGEGNINEFPFFVAPSEQDYSVCDVSPCVDAGDPDVLDPDGTRSDIGVYFNEHPDCQIGLRSLLYVSESGSDSEGDGSPENPYGTIQHAINFALDNDTIIILSGTYHERPDFVGKNILLASNYLFSTDMEDVRSTIIVGGVRIANFEDSTARLIGLTIKGGSEAGVLISDANPLVSDNIICENTHGIYARRSRARLQDNLIMRNSAGCDNWGGHGGGLLCEDSANIQVIGCTIYDNVAPRWMGNETSCLAWGSAVYSDSSNPTLENCLIAFNRSPTSENTVIGTVTLLCCDIYGNDGGDFVGDIEGQAGLNGNFSADPLLCGTFGERICISDISPCVSENNECGELIGSLEVGCRQTAGPVRHVSVDGDDYAGDGSSGDPYATILRGIEVAEQGDTILVSSGTYTGLGNRDIDPQGKNLIFMSAEGPENTIIDCQGTELEPHQGFYLHSGEDSTTVISGFTITGGYAGAGGAIWINAADPTLCENIIADNSAYQGGGIYSKNSDPIITHNVIRGNSAEAGGGGLYVYSGSPTIADNTVDSNHTEGEGGGIRCYATATFSRNRVLNNQAGGSGGGVFFVGTGVFEDNLIRGNSAGLHGGGMRGNYVTLVGDTIDGNSAGGMGGGLWLCYGSNLSASSVCVNNNEASQGGGVAFTRTSPQMTNLTVVGNAAGDGSGVYCDEDSRPHLENCIIALNSQGTAIQCTGDSSDATLTCSNIYGNEGGDWVGAIEDQAGIDGNLSSDPLFCDVDDGNYRLTALSPCAPDNNSCGLLIGALEVGCIPTDVSESTEGDGLPASFALSQNYPNPFNPTTLIRFELPVASQVRLEVFNILGQSVTSLLNGQLPAGVHYVTWDGERYASGIYFYRIEAADFIQSKKMVLIK